ncbi:hypothetical protein B0T14DRAFT_568638 [Immersiella caudata]|uniref:Uncharacterized protein n=1 Tax=Immersiella caudata TaxID=314043 RepID=A0AA39WKI3_9PEZI|nr:hypothetical protein B0T14DRAFT_568638 [Immersiella caudata]
MEFLLRLTSPAWELLIHCRAVSPLLLPFTIVRIEVIIRFEPNLGHNNPDMENSARQSEDAQDAFLDIDLEVISYHFHLEFETSSEAALAAHLDDLDLSERGEASYDPCDHASETSGFQDIFGDGDVEEADLNGFAAQPFGDVLLDAFVDQFDVGH